MPIRQHSCISLACDVCGYVYDEDEYRTHFADLAEARKQLHGEGWLITSDQRVYCATDDEPHRAANDALMPPEPVVVPDGQLAFATTPITPEAPRA